MNRLTLNETGPLTECDKYLLSSGVCIPQFEFAIQTLKSDEYLTRRYRDLCSNALLLIKRLSYIGNVFPNYQNFDFSTEIKILKSPTSEFKIIDENLRKTILPAVQEVHEFLIKINKDKKSFTDFKLFKFSENNQINCDNLLFRAGARTLCIESKQPEAKICVIGIKTEEEFRNKISKELGECIIYQQSLNSEYID